MASQPHIKDGKRVVKQLRLMIDQDESDPRLLEEWAEAIGKVLAKYGHVTKTGSHYLIIESEKNRGEVCRVEDFDPETRDFKPGATPPAWAGGQPAKGPHKLSPDGMKIPIEGAPVTEKKSNGGGKQRIVPRRPALDEDVIDLSEDTFTEKEYRETQDKAEVEASDAATDVASSFRKKLRRK